MRGVKLSRSPISRSIFGAVGAVPLGVALAAGATQASPAPPTTVESGVPVPDGFRSVEDDTHTIGIAIPNDWTVDPVGNYGPLGKLPSVAIFATAPGPEYDHPYLDFTAYPIHGIPQPWDPSRCDPMANECPGLISTSTYDDGSFVGYRQTIEGCCASGIFDVVEANAHDGSVNVDVQLNFGSERDLDEVALFETMLGTIARVGAPMPPVEPLDNPVFPYNDFSEVPQLGSEPVRGTGCGANGEIGETIPDGIWAGFATVDGASVGVDLLCVYTAEGAGQFVDASDHVIWADADSMIVNNNEQVRTMPAAAGLQLRDALPDGNGNCVESSELPDVDHSPFAAWLNIEGGEVTWVVWGCDAISEAGAEPQPHPTPAPPTSAAGPGEAAAIAADCEYAQNIIWEGDMYIGIEFPPDGSPITGDLLWAVEVSRDYFESDRPYMQSQIAQTAFANHYAAWSEFVDGGVYTEAEFQATVDAGWAALLPFQEACGLPGSTSLHRRGS